MCFLCCSLNPHMSSNTSELVQTCPVPVAGPPGVWFGVPLAAGATHHQHQDGGLDDNSERRAAQLY